MKTIQNYISILISMSGYVPGHATFWRTFIMVSSLLGVSYITTHFPSHLSLALVYFFVAEVLYIGLIFTVLPKKGLRLWMMDRFGEERGYRIFEALLGFAFFHNGISIAYVSSASMHHLSLYIPLWILVVVTGVLFISGLLIKVLATKVVSVDVYYWKDMFLGKPIGNFVVSGPYKYFSNPMYGVGHLHSYAIVLWYGSIWGVFVTLVNQILLFTFYYVKERKFIERVHA